MHHRTRIKVCGITRVEDAAVAVAAGADALGVIFAPSPRQVTVDEAAVVLANVPPPVGRVGVFVDASLDDIARAIDACGLTAVQLSGIETPAYCDAVPVPVIKVAHVGTHLDLSDAESYRAHAAALLLDTLVIGKAGGSSRAFEWEAIGELPAWAPSFVAGGLNPDNVGTCIGALHPFAVDVSSGVEAHPGVKDHQKVLAFCAAVRAADSGEGTR